MVDDEIQIRDGHFEDNYSDDDDPQTFLPHTDAQGWEEPSVKKKRTRTKIKKKKRQPVLSDDETPKRRPLSKEFHKNKENQRLDSHNNMAAHRLLLSQ